MVKNMELDSNRNLKIYNDYIKTSKTAKKIASEYGLTERTVRRIIRGFKGSNNQVCKGKMVIICL